MKRTLILFSALCLVVCLSANGIESGTPVDEEWIVDVNCGGICEGGVLNYNGTLIVANFQKRLCITDFINEGNDNLDDWVEVCGQLATSTVGYIDLNDSPEAGPSRIYLSSVNGSKELEFPAKVRVELYSNLHLNGAPTMRNQEPIVLEAQNPVNEWPPVGPVEYHLTSPISFVSDDGEHQATFEKAIVTMEHGGLSLALR